MSNAADRLEIFELLNRHQVAIDFRDADAYADVFAPDGRFVSPFATAEGTAALRAMTLGLHASGFTEGKRHFLGPVQIEIRGDEATAVSYWWVAETRPPTGVFATGTYTDRLRKISGRWKITERRQESDQVPASSAVPGATADHSGADVESAP